MGEGPLVLFIVDPLLIHEEGITDIQFQCLF